MTNKKNYFPHIDGLRALAICSVFIYHYHEAWLPSGYLGVDIFFVISGFVISSYLSRTEASNWYQYLGNFYVKRIKRLLPALLFCVVLSSIAIVALTTRPSADIFRTGATSLFGLSNVFLFLRSADYFSLDSSLNAFTHTWSLGVEEQFYIFYPILIFSLHLTQNRYNQFGVTSIFLITIISFFIYIGLHLFYPMAAFYLLPARAWELGVGALTYFVLNRNFILLPRWLSWASLIAVIASLFLPSSQTIIATILAVFGTAALINSCLPKTNIYKILTLRPVIFIGLISYSLYLWHWPILVLGKLTIGTFGWASLLLVFLTVVMALLSYYFVERPLRYVEWFPSQTLTIAISISIIFVFAPAVWSASNFASNYNNIIASFLNIPPVIDWSDDVDCNGRKDAEEYNDPLDACLSANRSDMKPNVVYLIGDSHAAQLYFMFNKALLNTKYSLRFVNLGDSDFPQNLFKKNGRSKTLDYIIENAEENDVLAITFHRGHLNAKRDKHIPLSNKVVIGTKAFNFIENASHYISSLQNKRVNSMLIRDTPLMNTVATSPSCLMQIRLFGKSTCRVNKEQDLHTRKQQDQVFDNLVSRFSSICAWDPIEKLYMGKRFLDVTDESGDYVMWDWNHITKDTSEKLSLPFLSSFNACINK